MKRFIVVISIIFVCIPAFAGIFDAIATIAESSGMEARLGDIKATLDKIKDQQEKELGTLHDPDITDKLCEFYDEMAKQSVQHMKLLYTAAQAAADEGGDPAYWEQKASDFQTMFKSSRDIIGNNLTIADVTKFMKLDGVPKEVKLKYIDSVLANMRKYYATESFRNWSEYYAKKNLGSNAEIDKAMCYLIDPVQGSSGIISEDSSLQDAEIAALEIEETKSIIFWVIFLLVIALAVGTIAISIKKYMAGEQSAQELFIRIAVGVALAAAILLVLSKVHI